SLWGIHRNILFIMVRSKAANNYGRHFVKAPSSIWTPNEKFPGRLNLPPGCQMLPWRWACESTGTLKPTARDKAQAVWNIAGFDSTPKTANLMQRYKSSMPPGSVLQDCICTAIPPHKVWMFIVPQQP